MTEKQLPHEVAVAAAAIEHEDKVNAAHLAKLKGDSEDSPTRAAAAVALKVDGAGYSDIAKILDYSSPQRARRAIEEAIGNQAGSPEEIEHVRWINNRRLERLLLSVMTRATNPGDVDHLAYLRAATSLVDRQLKLWGADSPQQLKITVTPSSQQIDAWVSRMAAAAFGQAEEADILDAEIVSEITEAIDESGEGEI